MKAPRVKRPAGASGVSVFYFFTHEAADRYARAHSLGTDYRIVSYDRGFAIQAYKSGPYWGARGWGNTDHVYAPNGWTDTSSIW